MNLPEQFFSYLEIEKKYSPRTVREYKLDLNVFSKFIYPKQLLDIDKTDIRSFLAYLTCERNYTAGSILRKLAMLRSFYSFCVKEEFIIKNPLDFIEKPKQPKKLPIFLTEQETRKLIQFAFSQSSTQRGKRNYAIIYLMLGTGLRISELTNLKTHDIEHHQNDCTIKVKGKGDKERILPVIGKAKHALESWLLERPASPYDQVFINFTTLKPLTNRGIQKMVKQLALKSGINKKITPHKLRHTFATNLLRNEANIVSIQELLGHESLNTTRIYTHVTTEDTRKAVKKLSFI